MHALYSFLVLSLALAFSYLLRHTLYLMWYCISDMYDRVRVSIFHAHACFALQMRLWGEKLPTKACVFYIWAYVKHLCACFCFLHSYITVGTHYCMRSSLRSVFLWQRGAHLYVRLCVVVCHAVSVFPTWYLKSSNTVSITLTLFQFSCRYHIIPCPGNKTPNTQATEVIQLQIEMELSVDLLKVFDVFLKPQWTACFYILFFLDVEVL